MAVLIASPQRKLGKLDLLIMLLIISLRVRLRLSDTPFCSGLPGMVYWAIIPHSCKYLAKGPICCPVSSCLPKYSPPRSDLTILITFPSCFSTSSLKILNFSSTSDFSLIKKT